MLSLKISRHKEARLDDLTDEAASSTSTTEYSVQTDFQDPSIRLETCSLTTRSMEPAMLQSLSIKGFIFQLLSACVIGKIERQGGYQYRCTIIDTIRSP